MISISRIFVTYHCRRVGTLTMAAGGRCAFEYDRQWLADGFSISPLDLPLKAGVFIAKPTPFYGNFGIFEDCLPDGYGRYLLNRLLRKQGIDDEQLTPLQRLSIVGSMGMGALCYEPQQTIVDGKPLPELDKLQEIAINVLAEKTDENADVLYFNSGNSGGCRPKCLYHDEDGAWLVKFRHTYDPTDIGHMEFRYNVAARRCGIDVPDFKLLEGKYFASKRFDVEHGERLHVATAGALLNESIQNPKLDYSTLLSLTGYLTQDPRQVEQMFRRMVFNIVTENKDDHPKNFSFVYSYGKWKLAPAYDLTYSPAGYNGEHATSANYNGNPTLTDVIKVAAGIRIKTQRAKEIIAEVESLCGDVLRLRL